MGPSLDSAAGFFSGSDRAWNIFDFLIVVLSVIDAGLGISFHYELSAHFQCVFGGQLHVEGFCCGTI